MPKYLTVTQYRNADDGIPVTNMTDLTLATYVQRAETDIDAYMGFDLMRGGFEWHQVWMQARFNEKTLRTPNPNYPVPIRNVQQYRIQVSNISTAGAGFFATINPADAVVNSAGGYVEIVPLQAVTYSLSPVLLQLGLRPPIVQMDCNIGFFLPVFGEMLYPTDPNFKVYAAARGFWAQTYDLALSIRPLQVPPIPPVIYSNGVATTSYTSINYTEGTITFPTSMQGNTVTADYTYMIPDPVRDAALEQTSHLLAMRALNKLGMSGLAQMKNGDVEIRTSESYPAKFPDPVGALCDAAARKLAGYKPIPIA